MEASTCKLALLFLILEFCIAGCAAASPLENQIWWTKRTRKLQEGCTKMCCSGQNSTCYATGPKMGSNGAVYGRCFCDENCLNMGDCCEDYSTECQAVDCVVDEWESYGACSKPCGLGAKTRRRQVIQEPRNGGQACPVLKESTVCVGTKCKSQRHLGARGRADLETARIMPATFGQYRGYRKYNAHMDIRKNLFYKYYSQQIVKRKGYCATYEVTSARLSCSSNNVPWSRVLRKGTEICVECQPKAMGDSFSTSCIGHGSTQQDTFWTAVNSHGCHGWWRRVNDLQECSCSDKGNLGFIFI